MREGTKKVMLKLSGEVFAWNGHIFDYERVDYIAMKLVKFLDAWYEVAVVCWAGNIWRWRDTKEAKIDRVKSDHLWMMATVMNAVLLCERVIQNWGKGVVFSPTWVHIPPITKEYNTLTARRRMKRWKIVFCAWGTGNPFSTTDSWAILRALELECEIVIKATKVDGVYTKDPNRFDDATKYTTITYEEALEKSIKVMDQSALWMAKEEKMPIFVCHLDELEKTLDGFDHGTVVKPQES